MTLSEPRPAVAPAPRTSLQLLGDRNFGIFFWGKLASIIGIWAYLFTAVTLAYSLTGSATWVGVIGAAQLVPQLALAMLAGKVADRRGPLVPVVIGVLLSGTSSLALGVWLVLLGSTGAVWVLLVASLCFGCGLALSAPAMHSVVPRLVSRDELSTAGALNFLPTALGRALGPALGAFVVVAAGTTSALVGIAAVCFVSGCAFTFARLRPPAEVADGADTSIRAALHYVRTEPRLVALLAGVALVSAGSEPAASLAPVLVDGIAHDGGGGGVVVTAFGVGGLLGVAVHRLVSSRCSAGTEGLLSMIVLAGAMVAAGLAGSLVALAVAMGVAGVCAMVGTTAFSVAVQQHCRPDMIGRVMALWTLAFAGARPFASLSQGLLADHVGIGFTLGATAVAVATASACVGLGLRRSR